MLCYSVLCFSGNDFNIHAVLSTNDRELYRISNGPLGKEPVNVVHAGHLAPIYGYDDIAFSNTAAGGRALRRYRHDLYAGLYVQPVKAHKAAVQAGVAGLLSPNSRALPFQASAVEAPPTSPYPKGWRSLSLEP